MAVAIAAESTFYTHDNGSKPFRVVINGNRVRVYKRIRTTTCDSKVIVDMVSPEIFIGKSPLIPMTEFSGAHGKKFDGNSFLLRTNTPLEYMYIGERIFTFRSLDHISEYVSPVGNSDVPYPYAVDHSGNYYLVIEKVTLLARSSLADTIRKSFENNPYIYYYRASLLTPDLAYVPPEQPLDFKFDNPVEWRIGNQKYTMRYHTDPDEHFDWVTSILENDDNTQVPQVPQVQGRLEMSILLSDKKTVKILNKTDYAELIHNYGKLAGFQPLTILQTISPRLF